MTDVRQRLVVAMPVHRGRISPLFEAARHLLVAELVGRRERSRQEIHLGTSGVAEWMEAVLDSAADLLVCGAISKLSLWHLDERGLRVHPGVVGDVEELIQSLAWTRTLPEAFAMPGTRCRSRP